MMVTKADIFACLEALDIKRSDKLTVHSSLKSIGEIEGGAEGLLDALCEYLSDGLLIIPSHTWDNISQTRFFDVRSTPACTGVLSRIATARADGARSLHPTHSVVVFGKGNEDYVRGEELRASTPNPPSGCLGRLYDVGGKILLLGVGHERNTFLHSVDERLKIKNRISKDSIAITMKDHNGKEVAVPEFHWYETPGVDEGVSEFYGNYEEALRYCGATLYSTLGNATAICCDAKKCVEVIASLWEKADYDLCAIKKAVPREYYEK